MNIELDDTLMAKIGVDEQEARELLAIALYKYNVFEDLLWVLWDCLHWGRSITSRPPGLAIAINRNRNRCPR